MDLNIVWVLFHFMLEKTKKAIKKTYDYAIWDLLYTAMYSTLAGIGNAKEKLGETGSILESIHNDEVYRNFGEGFVNNAVPAGFIASLAYPFVFDVLKKTKNFRLWANTFNILAMNGGFLAWHYYMGTENPISTQAISAIVGTAVVNVHVSSVREPQNNLETKLTNS